MGDVRELNIEAYRIMAEILVTVQQVDFLHSPSDRREIALCVALEKQQRREVGPVDADIALRGDAGAAGDRLFASFIVDHMPVGLAGLTLARGVARQRELALEFHVGVPVKFLLAISMPLR